MSEHYVQQCVHGYDYGQCRCPSRDKSVRIVPCPDDERHGEPPFSIPAAGGGTTIDWEARALAAEQALTEARAETEMSLRMHDVQYERANRIEAERDAARAETDKHRERAAELEAVRDGEVLVEGSWIPRRDLSTILGNFMRASQGYASEAKEYAIRLDAARAETGRLRDLADLYLGEADTWSDRATKAEAELAALRDAITRKHRPVIRTTINGNFSKCSSCGGRWPCPTSVAAAPVEPPKDCRVEVSGLPTDFDLAEFADCATCGGRITRLASEWFHSQWQEWGQIPCWRDGPAARPPEATP